MRTFSETLLENKSKWTSERAEEAPKHLSEDPSTAPRLFPLRLRLRLLLSLLSLLPEGRVRLCLLPPFLPTLSSDLSSPVSSSLLASFLPSFCSPVILPAPLSFHIPSFSLSSLVPSVLIWSGVSPSMCQHQQSSLSTHTQRQWTRGRTSVTVTLGAQEHLRSI